jgi:PAS domain S-box-containing protein
MRQSKEYKDLFKYSPMGYFIIDHSGKIRNINLAASQMIGLEKPEVVGKNLTSFMREKDSDAFYLFKKKIIENEGPHSTETTIINKVGEPVPILLKGIKTFKDNIQLGSIDMSKIKETQDKILSMAKLAEENPDPILRINEKFELIYLNTAAEKLLANLGIRELSYPKNIS